jgi:hypothetical protein
MRPTLIVDKRVSLNCKIVSHEDNYIERDHFEGRVDEILLPEIEPTGLRVRGHKRGNPADFATKFMVNRPVIVVIMMTKCQTIPPDK